MRSPLLLPPLLLASAPAGAWELPAELAATWGVHGPPTACGAGPARAWRCEPAVPGDACVVVAVPVPAPREVVRAALDDLPALGERFFDGLRLVPEAPPAPGVRYAARREGGRVETWRIEAWSPDRIAGTLVEPAGPLREAAYDHRLLLLPEGTLSAERLELRTAWWVPDLLVRPAWRARAELCAAHDALRAFLTPRPDDPPAGQGARFPTLATTPEGLAAAWWEVADAGTRLVASEAPKDAGWRPPVPIPGVADPLVNWADTPVLAAGPGGERLLTWPVRVEAEGFASFVHHARSSDGGRTWTPAGPIHEDDRPVEHGFPAIAWTGGGFALAWLDGAATAEGGPMALRGRLPGGPERVLDPRTCDCCGTAILPDGDGMVVFYRDRDEAEVRDISAVRPGADPAPVGGGDGWQVRGCPVNGPRAARLAGGDLVAAWPTEATGVPEVRIAWSADGGRSWTPARTVARGRGVLGRVDVVAAGGDAVVAWMAAAGEREQSIRVRRVAPDGTAGPAWTLAATRGGRAAGFPRMAAAGEDLVLLWTDVQEEGTRVRGLRIPLAALPAGREALPASAAPPVAGPAYAPAWPSDPPPILAGARGLRVLHAWASWCGPCRDELPLLGDLQARAPHVTWLLVAVDDQEAAARRLAAEAGLAGPLRAASLDTLRASFGIRSVPTTLVYDADGRLLWHHAGPIEDPVELLDVLRAGEPAGSE